MATERDTQGAHARDDHGAVPDPVRDGGASSRPASTAGNPAASERYASFVPAFRSARARNGGGKPSASGARPKTPAIVAVVTAAVLAGVYLAGAFAFSDRFMPNTSIAGKDVSFKSSAEVQAMLADIVDGYALDVSGQGLELTLSSADIGMGVDGERVTGAMHADANPWAWPVEAFRVHDETDKLSTSSGKLDETVRAAVASFNEGATPSTDATISYDADAKAFSVQEESVGTALDADRVVQAVQTAVAGLEHALKLSADALQQPAVRSDDPRLAQAADDANGFLKADFTLQLGSADVASVNADQVAAWVSIGDDATARLDGDAVAAWVQDIASQCNTYQGKRTYTRPDGKEFSVSGGVYGWIVDKEALRKTVEEGVDSGLTGDVAIPCEQEAGAYNGLHGRDWGERYVDVDLTEQHARLYDENGELAWESDIVTGAPDGEHDTPEGVYVLNNKESPSKLIGAMKPETGEPEYKTEVKTWMPFVDNYIGFHDADWQPAFGGSLYAEGNGSHGCVNLPVSKAVDLYDLIQVGDVVVVHW